uniref:Heat-and acid-stable phosphoprotein n=1 Tax=Zea mays TaxID=4577 RepID=B6T0M4_MAIZE|nr:heat- and acid-stable phosphoprotein [Zea mays]
MAKGRFKHKPTGERSFSSPEDIAAGTSAGRPKTFAKHDEKDVYSRRGEPEEESEDFMKPKHKGIEGLIEIENPNLVKTKNVKAKDIDIGKPTDMSRREREDLDKQKSHERHMKLQEQGKTEQARKDLEHAVLILSFLLA